MNQRPRWASLHTLGVGLWLVGSLLGEGLVFAGVGCCAAALLLSEPVLPFIKRYRVGLLTMSAWVSFAVVSHQFIVPPRATGSPWSTLNWLLFPCALLSVPQVSNHNLQRLASLAAGLLFVSGALCFVQFFRPFEWPFGNAPGAAIPVWRSDVKSSLGGYYAGGLLFHRLKYAHSLVPMCFAFYPWWRRSWYSLLAAAVALAGMFLAVVTAAWGALLIGTLAILVARRVPARRLVPAISALLIVPLLLVAFAHHPVDRQVAWRTDWELLVSHPIWGVGVGGYPGAALRHYGGHPHPYFPLIHLDAHSTLLQIMVEGGLVGSVLFAFGAVVFARWARERLRLDHSVLTPEAVGVFAVFASLSVPHNLAYHPTVLSGLALAFALAQRSATLSSRTPPTDQT